MPDPIRLRLSRARGFNLAAASLAANGLPAVNVARPGPWGNPFIVGQDGTRRECVRLHGLLMARGLICLGSDITAQQDALAHARAHIWALRGRNLACWCSLDGPCHADNLLVLANARKRRARRVPDA